MVTQLAEHFYRQNGWANRTIIDACRSLTDAQLDATTLGTYGSIRDTLLHIVSSEAGYSIRLGHEPSPRLQRDAAWPGLDAVAVMASAAADALVAASQDPANRTLQVGSDTDRFDVEAEVILVQAFNHSTEHRSQISTILTTLGIEPPELSGWEWGLAVDRMRRI